MPFKSDKQRKFLWSQKPEVAKDIAYKARGGPLKLTDDAADLARRNLDRIREQGDAPVRTRRERRSGGALAPRSKPFDWKQAADIVTDFVPGVGEAKDVYRAGTNIAAGNYGAAALDAAAAGVGLVPGVGDAAAAGIRSINRASGPLAKGVRNVHGFERAQQRLPDLIPDQKTWNQVHEKALAGDIKVGDITRRDKAGAGGAKDTRKGQQARNAAVEIDGKMVPVVVVPHKNPKYKWHIITTRDRGRNNDITDTLGGREYNKGGRVGGK